MIKMPCRQNIFLTLAVALLLFGPAAGLRPFTVAVAAEPATEEPGTEAPKKNRKWGVKKKNPENGGEEEGGVPAGDGPRTKLPGFTFEKMPKTVAELDLPLAVQEVAGVNRRQDICSSGIPMPCGLLPEPEGICVVNPAGNPVPAQFRVLERWVDAGLGKDDRSVKYLLVTFLADVKAGETAVYRLKAGKNPAPAKPAAIEKKGDGYVLNGLEFKSDFSAPFKTIFTNLDNEEIPAGELPLKWSVWEEGPVRACLKAESVTVPGKFGMIAYIYSYAGQKRWDLSITLKNTPNKMQGPLYFRDFSVVWTPSEIAGATDFHLIGESGKAVSGQVAAGKPAYLYQSSDGTKTWDTLADFNGKKLQRSFTKSPDTWKKGIPEFQGYKVMSGDKEISAGNFALGSAALSGGKGSAVASVRNFLHQYPKATEVEPGKFTVRLWPKYYGGYEGRKWLDDCQGKTHEISFVLSDGAISAEECARLGKAFDAPMMAFPGVDWTRKTDARQYYSERYRGTGSEIGEVFLPSKHNWLTWGAPPDRSRRRYSGCGADGWYKTGDMYHAYKLRRYMIASSIGTTPFFVDEYTYPEGRDLVTCPTGYMTPPRQRGQYLPGTAPYTYNAWNDQHFSALEFADGWRLTGNPLALDCLKKLGVFMRFYVDTRKVKKTNNARRDSWQYQRLCEAYRITEDPELLATIKEWERIAWEEQINKARGYYACKNKPEYSYVVKQIGPVGTKELWVTESWPENSMTDALIESHRITGNENCLDMSMGIIDYLLAEAFGGWPAGYYYKIPLDPAVNARVKEYYLKEAKWPLRETLPGHAFAYLHTGEKRYWDVFSEAVEGTKNKHKDRTKPGAGKRTTGVHYDWSNLCDQAIEEKNPDADHEPPEAVTDLSAKALGGGKVEVSWTCPAGDPARYQLKWAALPMKDRIDWQTETETHSNWWAAENVANEPKPAAGKQSVVVENIAPGKRIFCIRSWDADSNRSAMSNMAEVEVK